MELNERLNEIRVSNEGYEMKIVEYNNSSNITIEFQDEHKARVNTSYRHFKSGSICNPYHKSVCNIGYFGVGKYKAKINGEHTPAYKCWYKMMKRCYDPYFLNKDRNVTYINCFVCEEWHNFQNFAKWYEDNYYEVEGEKMELDKDILVKGNKIYSPNTCIFVPVAINKLFNRHKGGRGRYPIGVSYNKYNESLYVYCHKDSRQEYLGCFSLNKPFQAFYTYKVFKEKVIKQVADEYKNSIPQKLYEAMHKYEVEIND